MLSVRWLTRLWQELRDLVEYVVLPGLAAVLPWRLCYRLFRVLAHWPWLYGRQCTAALEQAQLHGMVSDGCAAKWLWMRRLVTLLDHADHYLFRTRSTAWMKRHVRVRGAWAPVDGAALLWTFHWGMGMWALCHARAHGIRARMVLAAPQGRDFAGRAVFGWYVRARMRSVALALGTPVIFVPGGMREIRESLEEGQSIVVVMDVPQDQVSVTSITELLGMRVSVPAILPRMAQEHGLPVTVFHMGLDVATGDRLLTIDTLEEGLGARALMDQTFAQLDFLLRREPAAWHLWTEAPRFFVARDEEEGI